MSGRILLGAAVLAAIVAALLILRGVREPAARAPAARDAAALPPSPRSAVTVPDAGVADDPAHDDDSATDDTDDDPAAAEAARLAEFAASAQRARQRRMSSAVRGALAGVVRACAPELGTATPAPRAPIFLRTDARWTAGQISLRDIDVRLGAQPAPPRFARCVRDRATALQLPWIADEATGSAPLSFTFSSP